MDQRQFLSNPISLEEYNLAQDQEYNDQFSGHEQQALYTTAGAIDPLRRDAAAPLHSDGSFTYSGTNSAVSASRYQERGVAPDTSYPHSALFADANQSAITTSPTSANSNLAYTTYSQNNYTALPAGVQHPQGFVSGDFGTSCASIIHGPNLLQPQRPIHSPGAGRENYISTPVPIRPPVQAPTVTYGPLASTPRSFATTYATPQYNPAQLSYSQSNMATSNPSRESIFPWTTLETFGELTCDSNQSTNKVIGAEVHAKVEKGFFESPGDNRWTCYRRNYFSVVCHYEIHNMPEDGRLFVTRPGTNTRLPVTAMGMRLSAAVDGSTGKNIELVQHTPKRDNGPKTKIPIVRVSPVPHSGRNDHILGSRSGYPSAMTGYHPTCPVIPWLPLQNAPEPEDDSPRIQAAQLSSQMQYGASAGQHTMLPGQNTSHTFERVQFKQATANNGKRRASQQFFHLLMELFADVRADVEQEPEWIKVCHRVSDKVVVRGRSPSHYQNEGQHQNGRHGASGSGSGGYTSAGAGPSNYGASGFRSSGMHYAAGMGPGQFYQQHQGYGQPREASDGSDEGTGTPENEAMEADYSTEPVLSEAERKDLEPQAGYRYYPGPIYESMAQPPALPMPKVDNGVRFSTDPQQWAVKHEYGDAVVGTHWPASGLGRFQGVESSRGYFPDLSTTYA